MGVPQSVANAVELDLVKPADQARNSKITSEYLIVFGDAEGRDIIKSYASGLARAKGQAGLRLDIPPCLKGSHKILNDHGMAMVNIYGKEVKRNIRFDDTNEDLMMDLKLPTSSTWYNITIEQAREARRAREQLDMQNIRQIAMSNTPSTLAISKEKARALMLAISPDKNNASEVGNFKSTTGVVHINNTQDWRNFEADQSQTEADDTMDRSVEEILRGTR